MLLRSPCTVIPFRVGYNGAGIIVEGYPNLVAMKAIGRQSYKSDLTTSKNDQHREFRNSILEWDKQVSRATSIRSHGKLAATVVSDCLDDPEGDKLDDVLCDKQAAWSWSQRQARYGVPNDCDLFEGWIVDPCLLSTTTSGK